SRRAARGPRGCRAFRDARTPRRLRSPPGDVPGRGAGRRAGPSARVTSGRGPNDDVQATERRSISDVSGVRVGHWTDIAGLTGCTVVLCPAGTLGSGEVRGGAPGTRETDLLRPGTLVQEIHAVLLTGGSA